MMIRSLLLSGAASLALATGAMAADLSNMKEPPVFMPPAPPPYSWSGFYIGINGGYGGDQFVYPGSFYDVTNNHSIVSGQASLTSGGFLGGGQVGFNYQFMGNVVAGIEADIDASSIRGQLAANASGFGNTISAAAGTHLDYLGTVRGRLGYAFGNVMPYVTGGFAYGETNSYYNIAFNGVGPAGSEGNWQDGWTAGAGLEYAITRNLTFKTEYLYASLGDATLFNETFNHTLCPHITCNITIKERATFNIVRAGFDWKFDWWAPPAPIVAKY